MTYRKVILLKFTSPIEGMIPLAFNVVAEDEVARTGILEVNGKRLETPNVIYAATYGQVNCVSASQFKELGVSAVMVNTFQLARPPSSQFNTKHTALIDQIEEKGGIAAYMQLNGQITMSDSGGFQVMSYGDSRVEGTGKVAFPNPAFLKKEESRRSVYVDDDGATFRVLNNGTLRDFRLTPRISMQLQARLQTDIAFAFDQCHTMRNHEETKKILERSHRWEQASLTHRKNGQAVYGIVHGGQFKDLRLKSAAVINALHFDGLSIGGYLGNTPGEMHDILAYTIPAIDRTKPLHLLGIGRIENFFASIAQGVDTFDCVEITRFGRHNWALVHPDESDHRYSVLVLKAKSLNNDNRPLSSYCACSVCKTMSRAELVNLKVHHPDREIMEENKRRYRSFITAHNIAFVSKLMSDIRVAIKESRFEALKNDWLGVIGSKK